MFIVHAAPDKAAAIRLHTALRGRGINVFVDNSGVPPAEPWDQAIPRALRDSLLQVVLLGDDLRWYQAEEIQLAIAAMRAHGASDRVVPVLLDPRYELPYGLSRVQALVWEGPDPIAAAIADKVAALRGASAGAAVRHRVKIAVIGLRDEIADALEVLRRRLAQHTALLEGEVGVADLGDALPNVDLRVVLLASRHGGKLSVVRDLVAAAARDPASCDTVAGAIDIHLRKVPAAYQSEATEMQLLGVPITGDGAATVIDQLDAQVVAWYAARFPSGPGMSITREPWEDSYLHDKAPLWRNGDPSALRTPTGTRVDRARWYVHLKAARPWAEVAGELRFAIPTHALLESAATYDGRDAAPELSFEIDPGYSPGVPEQLWWLEHDLKRQAPGYYSIRVTPRNRHILRNHAGDASPPWLDVVLSHRALPRCVVVGGAGTGKTVLLQHLAWVLASHAGADPEAEAVHHVDRDGVRGESPTEPIPVLHSATTVVEHLRRGRPIREALVALLRSHDTFGDAADPVVLRAGIDAGRYVFLIDSLDEVPARHDRDVLVAALGALTGPTPRVVLTTRPSPHTAVELPSGFVRVDIAPLDEDAVLRLTSAWVDCWLPGEDLGLVLSAIHSLRRSFPAQSEEHSPVENPLLLSCILQVYATYRRLPDDTARLYSDIVRILCEAKIRVADDHDRDTRVERYREALRELSLATQETGGTRLDITAACELLVTRRFAGRGAVENWLNSLANHTGLIRFEGGGDRATIRPWHRSYQEYLAAEALALTYANRADACVEWLRAARCGSLPRLRDPSWRGTLRFLVGAAVHQHRAWGVQLIDALLAAAAARDQHQARLLALAVEATAEYATTLFQNELLRHRVPRVAAEAFVADGDAWPLHDRLDVLDALGRLGDPRLPDPRQQSRGDGDPGWIPVPRSVYTVGTPLRGATASRATEESRSSGRRARSASILGSAPLATHANPGFWIRRWPITVAEFIAFVDHEPSVLDRHPDSLHAKHAINWRTQTRYPNRPVVNVSWAVARLFCAWAQTHWKLPCDGIIDLPTSTEWEIAARRDTDRVYPWGNADPAAGDRTTAAYARAGLPHPCATPVGAFPRGHTPEGVWDMAGNVFEWCASWYMRDTEVDLPIDRPHDLILSGEMVYRGGCWARPREALELLRRGSMPPWAHDETVGFRVICRPGPTVNDIQLA